MRLAAFPCLLWFLSLVETASIHTKKAQIATHLERYQESERSGVRFLKTPANHEIEIISTEPAFEKASSVKLPEFPNSLVKISVENDSYAGDRPLKFSAWPFYVKSKQSPKSSSNEVSLFTQLSVDRLGDFLREFAKPWRWNGWSSVVVYIETPNDLESLQDILEKQKHNMPEKMSLHLLFGYLYHAGKDRDLPHPYDFLYPINTLRNLAMYYAPTDLIFSIDADFIPSDNLYKRLTDPASSVAQWLRERETNPFALVIPAFEILEFPEKFKHTDSIEWNVDILFDMCSTGHAIPFHAKRILTPEKIDVEKSAEWCLGRENSTYHVKNTRVQSATNYQTWFQLSFHNKGESVVHDQKPYELVKIGRLAADGSQFLDFYYEPYYISTKQNMILFDEHFRGYSFNKRQQSTMMQALRTPFFVLPGHYVVHRPHEQSRSKNQWSGKDPSLGALSKYLQTENSAPDSLSFSKINTETLGRLYRMFKTSVLQIRDEDSRVIGTKNEDNEIENDDFTLNHSDSDFTSAGKAKKRIHAAQKFLIQVYSSSLDLYL